MDAVGILYLLWVMIVIVWVVPGIVRLYNRKKRLLAVVRRGLAKWE